MVKELSDQGPDGSRLGTTSSDKISFYGASVVTQQSSANFADLSFAATTAGFGFANATAFNNHQSQLQQVVTALKALGLVAEA